MVCIIEGRSDRIAGCLLCVDCYLGAAGLWYCTRERYRLYTVLMISVPLLSA